MMDEAELDLLTEWLERFKHSERYCQDFFESGKKNYKMYKSYKESGEKVYKHDIFVPYSYAYLEDMTSYFMLSLMASPVLYAFERRMRALSPELCRQLEQIVDWVVKDEEAELPLELEEVLKNIGIYNVGYLINYPVIEERRISGGSQMNLFGASGTEKTFRRLHADAPCPLDIFPEPNVKRISRMRYIFKRSWETITQLKEWEKSGQYGYKNIDEAKGGLEVDNPVVQRLQTIGIASVDEYYNKKEDKVELLDCMQDGNVITIGGRRAIIRDTTKKLLKPFDYPIPILDCRLSGAPGEFFGLHTLESIREVNKELNVIRSQRRDNVSLLLNKVFTLDLLAGEVDLNTLFSAPGNVITGSNIKEALSELDISDVTASSYKESQELQYDLQSITSLWDYARGGTPRRRETATGIIRLQQAAQSRNEWLLRKFDF